MVRKTLLFIALFAIFSTANAQRTVETLTDGWELSAVSDVMRKPTTVPVSIPHSWNLEDVFNGPDYKRTSYIYTHDLRKDSQMQGKRVFLKCDAVNSHADIVVNHRWIGEHKGGYTAFCFEITDYLNDGDNTISIVASNAYRTDVLPLGGDFNVYGGITRPVHLIITGQDCISPLDHASDGVYVHQNLVNAKEAMLTVETVLSRKANNDGESLKASLIDRDGKVVASSAVAVPRAGQQQSISIPLTIGNPHLWNGRKSPYLYTVKVELLHSGNVIDEQTVATGLRSFSVDAAKGFFLNGEHVDLHGVCRHEEGYKTGGLYNEAAMRKDARLVYDLGSTGIRLVHYPHSRYDISQYDSLGIVVWSELLPGPGGYRLPGYVANPAFEESVMNNLEEMIKQNYNSPSICFWSLFNELSHRYDSPDEYLKKLNARAKELDPQRLTTMGICYDQDKFQGISDLLAWNKYYGWYNGKGGVGDFFDKAIVDANGQPVGLSEYGAPASIHQHGFEKIVSNDIHLEEYQAKVHEDNWRDLAVRPKVWCKFIWQFADNPSAIRNEGDAKGINDKGIVTYDRKTCKDSYYFYQANWSSEPMACIAARRYTQRPDSITDIKVYTNQKDVTLWVNGKKIGKARPDSIHRAVFKDVELKRGENTISIKAGKCADSCVWTYDPSAPRVGKEKKGRIDGAV